MDVRKQPPLAPLALAPARREGAGERKAFHFEGGERGGNPLGLKTERAAKLRERQRTLAFEPPAHELDQGRFRLPSLVPARRRGDGGLDDSTAIDRLELA